MIVGSILMAFGLQAWWDERQERAEEIEALAQLLEEFKSNSSELVAIRAINLRSLSASRELLALSGRLGVPNSTRSTTELLLDFPTLQSYDPVLGTLNSLIASGRLGILQSDSLRAALSEWPSNVEDLATNEEWTTSFYFDRIWPYLAEGGVGWTRWGPQGASAAAITSPSRRISLAFSVIRPSKNCSRRGSTGSNSSCSMSTWWRRGLRGFWGSSKRADCAVQQPIAGSRGRQALN